MMMVLGVLFTLIALVALVALLRLKSLADTATQTVSAESGPPLVDAVEVTDDTSHEDVTLNGFTPCEGTTCPIRVDFHVSDPNGCNDISNVTVALSKTILGLGEQQTGNNTYVTDPIPLASLTNCTGAEDLSADGTVVFDIQNYVDPTDTGSPYEGLNWYAEVIVTDVGESPSDPYQVYYTVNSLNAFSTAASIDYGTVSLGANSVEQTIAFANTGNRTVNTNIRALGDMTSNLPGYADIPAGNAHYSLESMVLPGGYDAAPGITTSDALFEICLLQQTADGMINIPSVNANFMLQVPSSGVNGTYSNTLAFTAEAAPFTNGIGGTIEYTCAGGGGGPGVAGPTTYTWSETQPVGATAHPWYALASSANGFYIIAAENKDFGTTGRLYVSTSGGLSWTEVQPAGDTDQSWISVASDSTGNNLIAAAYNGRIYTSSNAGVDWTERTPAGAGNKSWESVASDSTGSNLIAAVNYGRVYISTNGGVDWTETQPAGAANKAWFTVASDADGSTLIAAENGGRLYVSTNGGTSWTQRTPAGAVDKVWQSVDTDGTGSKLVAAVNGGRIYTSSNGGVDWLERTPNGAADKNWQSVASNSTGDQLIAATYYGDVSGSGRIYVSNDSGETWTANLPVDAGTTQYWLSVAIDDQGSHVIVGQDTSHDGRLYTGSAVREGGPVGKLFEAGDGPS